MSEKVCKIIGCRRSLLYGARGYCGAHYRRYLHGRPLKGPIRPHNGKQGCKVTGCKRKHDALGYCITHYGRQWAGRLLEEPIRDGKQGCVVAGCEKKHASLGYCSVHAVLSQWREKKIQLTIEFGERCADCHRKYPPCVFDFDNLGDPEDHTNLGKLLHLRPSWDRIAEEVSKCDMVCSNCHRIRTQERRTTRVL